jgi:hypothetical protein
MKKHFTIFLFFVLGWLSASQAQQFMNGSFENTTAVGCQWNLVNSAFNSQMADCFAWGVKEELDIQMTGCQYGPPSIVDEHFISLHSYIGIGTDALTLFTNIPCSVGDLYEISFYLRADYNFTSTTDSLSIGITADSSQAGTILQSFLPDSVWRYYVFVFQAPLTSRYITVQNSMTIDGWNFVDGFKMRRVSLGIDEASPAAGSLQITNDKIVLQNYRADEVSIYSINGQLKKVVKLHGNDEEIDISFLAAGTYVACIKKGDAVERRKFIRY